MGITIVQKSDLTRPKTDPKIALVLSGGGISGGAFKLGGLQALSKFMVNRKIRDFDMFVGVSAGAIIATYLANGISAENIAFSLEGRRGVLHPIRASELYDFNYMDFLKIPSHLIGHTVKTAISGACDFLLNNNIFRKEFRQLVLKMLARPTYKNTEAFVKYCLTRKDLDVHQSWHFIPTGIFKTDRFEKSNRRNLKANNLCNDFTELYEKRGKELYIIASKLDTAERVVFGHDYIAAVPISKAMQASIAIPLFYKPVKIDGEYYVDGAMVKTTSMDLAIAKGADLIVCYNPFRPVHCGHSMACEEERVRRHIAEDGLYAVMNQVMRTLLHTRLMHGINLYRKNPDFQGDIILIEPSEYDDVFFDMNPLAFWERRQAAKRGFDSVKQSIGEYYDILSKIFHAYGIAADPGFAENRPLQPVMPENSCISDLAVCDLLGDL